MGIKTANNPKAWRLRPPRCNYCHKPITHRQVRDRQLWWVPGAGENKTSRRVHQNCLKKKPKPNPKET